MRDTVFTFRAACTTCGCWCDCARNESDVTVRTRAAKAREMMARPLCAVRSPLDSPTLLWAGSSAAEAPPPRSHRGPARGVVACRPVCVQLPSPVKETRERLALVQGSPFSLAGLRDENHAPLEELQSMIPTAQPSPSWLGRGQYGGAE